VKTIRFAPLTIYATLAACTLLPACAQAETEATLTPSFAPNRPGTSAAFTLALVFAGGSHGVPAPLSRVVVRLPAGLGVNLRGVASCAKSRLVARGPRGCPSSSALGTGHALLGAHLGSQKITESATLSAFRGPTEGGRPTLEISGQGLTPLDVRVVIVGVLEPDSAPYGSQLVMTIPTIPTLPTEPNASTLSFSLTLGGGHTRKVLTVPHHCPAGGLPFAGDFAFADGTSAEATATAACS
jgi:hypothetical protein